MYQVCEMYVGVCEVYVSGVWPMRDSAEVCYGRGCEAT